MPCTQFQQESGPNALPEKPRLLHRRILQFDPGNKRVDPMETLLHEVQNLLFTRRLLSPMPDIAMTP